MDGETLDTNWRNNISGFEFNLKRLKSWSLIFDTSDTQLNVSMVYFFAQIVSFFIY